jgi:hypothetical protein
MMQDNRSPFAATSTPKQQRRAPGAVTNRSRLTNQRWALEGVDNRLTPARRFRDLCVAYAKEAGDDLSETERSMIRSAAAMTLQSETLQAQLARGKPVSSDMVIRLASEARRILQPISERASRRKAAPGTPSALDEYLAREEVAS